MKNIRQYITAALNICIFALFNLCIFTACQDKDIEIQGMKLAAPDASLFQGTLNGYDYTITWPQPAQGHSYSLTAYRAGSQISVDADNLTATSYTVKNTDTNDEYWFVFRESDGTNQSEGTVVKFTREGATKISDLSLKQVEQADKSNNLTITWKASADAESYDLVATNGKQTITKSIAAGTTEYTIEKVTFGDTWNVSVQAVNSKGKAIAQTQSLLIGKTHLAFIADYATPEDLVANGDDDEASAWLWFHNAYPTADFIPFTSITSADILEPYRMLFFIRDIETGNVNDVFNFSDNEKKAATYIGQWAKDGGNLLLWSHAVPYIGLVGRLDNSLLLNAGNAIGCGAGGYNGDVWKMGAGVNTGKFSKDYTTHALYKGITPEYNSSGLALIACKGAGWTEDHNCCFYDIPAKLTGFENTSKECYESLTTEYGIYPLGTWDSQASWVSQFNVWEATTGTKVDFKGTCLCIGNGGLEFSMKNSDGSKDVSASPKNNSEQATVLKIAQNAVDYLMSK